MPAKLDINWKTIRYHPRLPSALLKTDKCGGGGWSWKWLQAVNKLSLKSGIQVRQMTSHTAVIIVWGREAGRKGRWRHCAQAGWPPRTHMMTSRDHVITQPSVTVVDKFSRCSSSSCPRAGRNDREMIWGSVIHKQLLQPRQGHGVMWRHRITPAAGLCLITPPLISHSIYSTLSPRLLHRVITTDGIISQKQQSLKTRSHWVSLTKNQR